MATPTTWPHLLVRRPPSSSTAAPASGNTSSSHAARCTPTAGRGTSVGTVAARAATATRVFVTPTPLVLQQVRVVHRRGPAGTEDRHQDRQPDDHFRGGDHHHEERGHLAVHLAVHARETDERQVDRVQHELDAHEDDQRVAADEHPDRADHEEDHGERHVVSRAHDGGASCPPESVPSPSGAPGPDGWAGLAGPAGSAPAASRRASLTASRAPGRPEMIGLTDSSAGLPSGSSAGKSTALWRA